MLQQPTNSPRKWLLQYFLWKNSYAPVFDQHQGDSAKEAKEVEHCQQQAKGDFFTRVSMCLHATMGKWVPAIVWAQTGPVFYTIQTCEDIMWRRHVDQWLVGTTTPEKTLVGGPACLSFQLHLHQLKTSQALWSQLLQDLLQRLHRQNCLHLLQLHLFLTSTTEVSQMALLPDVICWENGSLLSTLMFSFSLVSYPTAMVQNNPLGYVRVSTVHLIPFRKKSDVSDPHVVRHFVFKFAC